MRKFKFAILVVFVVPIMLSIFSKNASAAYYTSGTLTSKNLLSGLSVGNITSFWYNVVSPIPAGASLKVQFSRDNTSWYDSSGTLNGWNNCTTTGGATISLSGLGWTGANFYYKMQFTSDGTNTPVLEAVRVDYSLPNQPPSISSVSDSPDPVTAGSGITFTVNWSDPNSGDQTKTHLCRTNSISGQACAGGSWCDTTTWSTTSPTTCSYTTQSADVGIQNYYAFVCDDDNACSSSVSGTFNVTPSYTPDKTMCDASSGSGGGVVSAQSVSSPSTTTAISQRGWVVTGYDDVDFPTYSELKTMYGYDNTTTRTITNLSGVTGNGVYRVTTSDLTIAAGDGPPCNLGFSAVIFVDHNLTIGRSFTNDTVTGNPLDYRNGCSSSLAFIVSGNINIAQTINNIYGIFYAGGTISTGNGSTTDPLYVFGSLLAGGFGLGRNLQTGNATYPAEQVIFMPKYFFTLKDVLGIPLVSWKEVKSP